jgi:hypothetical protein
MSLTVLRVDRNGELATNHPGVVIRVCRANTRSKFAEHSLYLGGTSE